MQPTVRNGTGSTTTVKFPPPKLTLSSNVSLVGAEVRIYDLDSTGNNLGTELSGVESCSTSTFTTTSIASGNLVWIQIIKSGYVELGQSFVMSSTDFTLNLNLSQDVNA